MCNRVVGLICRLSLCVNVYFASGFSVYATACVRTHKCVMTWWGQTLMWWSGDLRIYWRDFIHPFPFSFTGFLFTWWEQKMVSLAVFPSHLCTKLYPNSINVEKIHNFTMAPFPLSHNYVNKHKRVYDGISHSETWRQMWTILWLTADPFPFPSRH